MTPSGVDLDTFGKLAAVSRKWSSQPTAECTVQDTLHGGWCESDEHLRQRILRELIERSTNR